MFEAALQALGGLVMWILIIIGSIVALGVIAVILLVILAAILDFRDWLSGRNKPLTLQQLRAKYESEDREYIENYHYGPNAHIEERS